MVLNDAVDVVDPVTGAAEPRPARRRRRPAALLAAVAIVVVAVPVVVLTPVTDGPIRHVAGGAWEQLGRTEFAAMLVLVLPAALAVALVCSTLPIAFVDGRKLWLAPRWIGLVVSWWVSLALTPAFSPNHRSRSAAKMHDDLGTSADISPFLRAWDNPFIALLTATMSGVVTAALCWYVFEVLRRGDRSLAALPSPGPG